MNTKLLKHRMLSLLLLMLIPCLNFAAEGFWLVTPSEQLAAMQKSMSSKDLQTKGFSVGGPTIELLAPKHGKDPIISPLTIELAFHAMQGAKVIPSTFKVMYGLGFFKLDITDRLLENAKVTEAGLLLDNAKLPPGKHSVTIEVQDDQNRVGSADYDFVIQES